jgi:hypothetical protein
MCAHRISMNLQELVIGACIGVSIIADALVRDGLIEREILTAPLAEAAMLMHGQRRIPLAAILWLMENLGTDGCSAAA